MSVTEGGGTRQGHEMAGSLKADGGGTVHVPFFDMPFPSFASRKARDAYVEQYAKAADTRGSFIENESLISADIGAARRQVDVGVCAFVGGETARPMA
jgi:hypothetical protein